MIRFRKSSNEWCFDLASFKKLDYGRICHQLGLRPSRPHKSARRGR